ncbi:phenylacetate--CoA ligase family protein [Piscinibacter sp. HJYY11]|uniref:phenylacetate--CoA ligase family protein n=1 Tax=Piscinibacter sp. HJYY11 TaxID=2801333 RepID=UPI00191F5273|nr:phenylacetate--CoA ligase family protein [Piscinibacter sp. HJYY11]MBL0726630.1 phenylacetate--CoA ligase family protein [Piscinibacter sp. HJYY11]
MAASLGGPHALAALQSRRLQALLRHAKAKSPLFRRLLDGIDPAEARLQDLPVTRKRELMARFDEWVTDPALHLDAVRRFMRDSDRIGTPGPGGYMVWQSSGSSGEAGVFVQDDAAMAVYDALESQRRPWSSRRFTDPWFVGERIAYVGATNGHFAGIASIRRLRRLNPVFAGRLHEVSFLQPMAQLVSQLNALEPTIVSTYPSSAVLLAQEHLAGRLRIRPSEIWTGGESMSPTMRRHVEQAFGCEVVDSYGASEFLALASPCRCGCLHLNSDWAILESVDRDAQPVPQGQLGATALLTNLANRLQPLIRYDLGDRIRVHAEGCDCGSPFPLIDVLGRHDDTLRLVTQGREVSVLPLALCTVLEEEGGLVHFQVVQRGPAELEIVVEDRAKVSRELAGRAARSLKRYLESVGARGVRFAWTEGPPVRHGPGGKVQRVVALRALA